VVSVMKDTCQSLALDITVYLVAKFLLEREARFDQVSREGDPPKGLKFISSFIGHFFNKFPEVDPLPLLEFLANRLAVSSKYSSVLLIEKLVDSMTQFGEFEASDLSNQQLPFLAGGVLLRLSSFN
jgi:hypothetical protein